MRDIDVLHEEMRAAGARFFAGGLESPSQAKSLREQPNGHIAVACRTPVEVRAFLSMQSE